MAFRGITGSLSEQIREQLFEWKIANFFSLSSKLLYYYYSSPSFIFKSVCCDLQIYPNSRAQERSFTLYFVNKTDFESNTSLELYIKKADGKLISLCVYDNIVKSDFYYGGFYKISDLKQNESDLLPSGILTIICILKSQDNQEEKEITIESEKADSQETQRPQISDQKVFAELDLLSQNFKDILANKDSCDTTLQVEDKEFKAHRIVLMARSSVFAAMFQHDTLEKKTGLIKIPDCDSESFTEFLEYLYCGKLDSISYRSAFHLYSTSNKYDVQELKEFCKKYLIKNLMTDKICDVVILADKYDDEQLLAAIHAFFNANWNKVVLTPDWESLMRKNYHLANKLFIGLSKSKGKVIKAL